MTRKSLGYVNLEWECPNCGNRNKGTDEVCTSCGAPQPENVQFEQPAQEEFIKDEAVIADAQKGADIHCPFCGTRNPADATTCSQCLGDLTEGAKRQSGQRLGAHRDKPAPDVACPGCGTMNPASNTRCQSCNAVLPKPEAEAPPPPPPTKPASKPFPKWVMAVIVVFVLLCCGVFSMLWFRTDDVTGEVTGAKWEYSIGIEEMGPVEHSDWEDAIPSSAEILSCSEEVRSVEDSPVPNSEEVCGAPYTIDTGSGVGEVVQDCEYHVYDDMCTYTVLEWMEVDRVYARGEDYSPQWPALNLRSGQREGEREEDYTIIFRTDGKNYSYSPGNRSDFVIYQPGSDWILKVNTFDAVVDVEPR